MQQHPSSTHRSKTSSIPLRNNRTRNPGRRGWTITEVIASCAAATLALAVAAPMVSGSVESRQRSSKDVDNVRSILQGMVVWGSDNKDQYPLPSRLDASNTTVKETGPVKDTTSNIYSFLIYNSLAKPEAFVSTRETNKAIKVKKDYQLANPATAIDPAKALWDPSFNADFTKEESHTSFAHALPLLPREAGGDAKRPAGVWGATFKFDEIALASRGPEIESATYDPVGTPTPKFKLGTQSNTFANGGDKAVWKGVVAWNDARVLEVKGVSNPEMTYTTSKLERRQDIYFLDDKDGDAPIQRNAYLSIFTKAGPARSDFAAIWD